MEMTKTPLLGMTLLELKEVARALGMPAFAGGQMAKWLYQRQVKSIDEMTDISKANRQKLAEAYEIGAREPIDEQRSVDGTVKYLFPTAEGKFVETVYIPDHDRATLCVSSQVGCKMNCLFCQTGKQGFEGSLTATDILNQIYSLPEHDTLTNIVFMGQGEPMDNLDNVLRATQVLTADYGYAWSPKRITVSSVGVRNKLKRFIEESDCHVAISLSCCATTTSPISAASRSSISSSTESTTASSMPSRLSRCSRGSTAASTLSASTRYPRSICGESTTRAWRRSETILPATACLPPSVPAADRTSMPPADC